LRDQRDNAGDEDGEQVRLGRGEAGDREKVEEESGDQDYGPAAPGDWRVDGSQRVFYMRTGDSFSMAVRVG
jgi:hypothetical protein